MRHKNFVARILGALVMGIFLLSPLLAQSASMENFTIIVLPDTQYYAQNDSPIFSAQTQWIVDNRETMNIAYVAHVGDVVQNAYIEDEWITANEAFSLLEDPVTTILTDGIPYGIAVGNHDQTIYGDPDGTNIFYNQYFGESRFLGRAYYGGNNDDGLNGQGNDNHFELFSAGGMDFIVIHLEYDENPDPNTTVLNWADARLKEYNTRRGIIVSHCILSEGNPGRLKTQGQAIYTALKDNPNLFLMLCGHVSGEGRRQDIFNGNTVHTLLADYQNRSNGGDGWLRIMEFLPDLNEIRVKTFSPTRNGGDGEFETDNSSQFTLFYDMDSTGDHFLVAHYEMEEDGGTTLVDTSMYANNGSITGDTTWASGVIGLSIDLDGNGDYATVPDGPSLDITDAITLAAWIKPEVVGTQQIIRKFGSGSGYSLFLSANRWFSIRLNGNDVYRVNTSVLYDDHLNEWLHIAATYDGSIIRTYVNGTPDNTLSTTVPIAVNSNDLTIGAESSGSNEFQGQIDDARIYCRALSATEIWQLANPCPGDLDGDDDVDGADLALLIFEYGCTSGCTYDLTGEGVIDEDDLAEFAMHYGKVCQ